jgi:hypothetical protein
VRTRTESTEPSASSTAVQITVPDVTDHSDGNITLCNKPILQA